MEERWVRKMDCDRTVLVGGDDGSAQGNQISQKRRGDTLPEFTPESKLNVCDRGGVPEGYRYAKEVLRNSGATSSSPVVPPALGISTNGNVASGSAQRALKMCDRRASLELRCLGIPVGRSGGSGAGVPSGLVISKVNPGSGSSRQELPIKDISRLGADVYRRNVVETSGGCDLAIVNKEKPRIPFRGPDVPAKAPPSHPTGYHNGEAPLHHGSSRSPPTARAVPLGDAASVTVSRACVGDGRIAAGALSPLTSRSPLRDGRAVGRSFLNTAECGGVPMGAGQQSPLANRRNGDVAVEQQVTSKGGPKLTAVPLDRREMLSHQRSNTKQTEDSGILGQILGNGEITLTPRVHPREDNSQRPQGIKRTQDDTTTDGHRDKRMMLEAVNLMERDHIPREVKAKPENLSAEMRSAKGIGASHPPMASYNSGFMMKEIKSERDEITIEPILDSNQGSYGIRRERYLDREGQARATESFASRYPLLREGLSKPCLRRRGRPPKMALQMIGRSRRYIGMRPTDYASYHATQPQVSSGLSLPEGTVVNPLTSQQQHRKSMSVDEVLSYYGSMQERKVSSGEPEGQRLQPRGEISMTVNTETSMPAMQNSSLAQIESLVQSQVPSSTGFFSPTNPAGMPRYSYSPNNPPSVPMVPGYSTQAGSYASQPVLMQDTGYYGMRYRGRGRPRGRGRARGRPRGNSGLYFHSTEREILPKPDYLPQHAEDVEEIVVEVDIKPEWDDEREVETARDDSLSEAQKLVPNWISVVPAKMPQSRRSAIQLDCDRVPPRLSNSVPYTAEVSSWGSKGSTSAVAQHKSLVPEKLEVHPSVEAILRQPKQTIVEQMPRTEPPKPVDPTSVCWNKAMDNTPRAADKLPETPNAKPEEQSKMESDIESAGGEESVESDVEAADNGFASGNETSEVGTTEIPTTGDEVVVGAEVTEKERGPSPSTANDALPMKEDDVKMEGVDEINESETKKEDTPITEKERSLQENRSRFKQMASSLASIKSLPKDVTVVRSRGKGSAFEGYGRQSTVLFPKSVAARLGPSIEIRRVGGSRGTRGRARTGEQEAVTKEVEEGSNGSKSKDAALHPRLPALSTIFSGGTSLHPVAMLNNSQGSVVEEEKQEEEEGSDDNDEASAPPDPPTDEEEPEEDPEDKPYRPTGYRGMGKKRRAWGHKASTTRSVAPKPRRKRGGRRGSKALTRVKIEEEERPGDWEVFVCDLCGRSFSKRFRLAHHIRAYHPREGTSKGEDGRRVFPCQQCSKSFTRKANLKKHLRIHTGEKPFVCEECGRAFTFSKNLAQHRRVHGMERPFVCEVCGHAFRFSKNLSQHRGVHAHLKPHVCNVCGRGFTRSTHLSQHKRLHSGEKPFRCSVCGKRFAQRGHAALHTRIHTGERPYACPVCGRAFSLRAHLVRHVALHQRDGEIGPGRPPPLPRRDRRGRDGVELVGAEEYEAIKDEKMVDVEQAPADDEEMSDEEEYVKGIIDFGEEEVPLEERVTEGGVRKGQKDQEVVIG